MPAGKAWVRPSLTAGIDFQTSFLASSALMSPAGSTVPVWKKAASPSVVMPSMSVCPRPYAGSTSPVQAFFSPSSSPSSPISEPWPNGRIATLAPSIQPSK